ncbi:acetyltransferase, GNAT family protein [Cryptosporidium serpentis]
MNVSSSAFPPNSYGPIYYSRVHKAYLSWINNRNNTCIIPNLFIRKISKSDIDQLYDLHKELFPIVYDSQFYDTIISGSTLGWATIWNCDSNDEFQGQYIVGFVTVSQNPQIIMENDYHYVIRNTKYKDILDNNTINNKHEIHLETRSINNTNSIIDDKVKDMICENLVYILTMGVVQEFRSLGIAKNLIEFTLDYYKIYCPKVEAIYLHVVDYNSKAIKLYRRLGFQELLHWDHFYRIKDQYYGSFLYVYYFNRNLEIQQGIQDNDNSNNFSEFPILNYCSNIISRSSEYLKNFRSGYKLNN